MKDVTKRYSPSDDSFWNPFRDDVFSGETSLPGTTRIHQDATRRCIESIDCIISGMGDQSMRRGEIVLVSSPVAGYGKSHLIGRVSTSVRNSVMMLPLSLGPNPKWEDLLTEVIDYQAGTTAPRHPEASLFDEVAARFLSLLIRSGISRGILNAGECPVSVSSLEKNYREAFGRNRAPAMVQWLKGKLARLSEHPFPGGSELEGFSPRDLLFWSRYFLKYFSVERKFPEIPILDSEGGNRERLLQLLRISASCRPLLIIADHLDSCHGCDTAGMEIATILTTFAERIPNSLVIFSLNRDLWESVFEENLPSAYLDRLQRDALHLESIMPGDARQLVIDRLYSFGMTYHKSFLFATALSRQCQWDRADQLSPRSVIRQAKDFWSGNGIEYFDREKKTNGPEIPVTKKKSKPGRYSFPVFKKPPPKQDPFSGQSIAYPDRPVPNPLLNSTVIDPTRLDPSIMDTFSGKDLAGKDSLQSQGPEESRFAGNSWPSNGAPPSNPVSQHNDDSPAFPSPANGLGKSNGNTGSMIPGDGNLMGRYLLQLERKFFGQGKPLSLDLPALESLLKKVGAYNDSVVQGELNITGGNSRCLRWDLSDFSVWIGFEPIRNVYYYSHVLEKVLTDRGYPRGKIICFSHGDQVYDRKPYLATGLTNDTLNRHFDIVHLGNEELAMIHAAMQLVREAAESGNETEGLRIVLLRLAPLWNRMCHPVKESN